MTSSLATDPSRHLQGTRVVHVAWFGGYAPAPAAVRVGVDVTAVNPDVSHGRRVTSAARPAGWCSCPEVT